MVKIKNPRTVMILNVILEDMGSSKYSTISNNEIASKLNMSVFSVRDKVRDLVNKKVLQRIENVWLSKEQFHNRVLYKGTEKFKVELLDTE